MSLGSKTSWGPIIQTVDNALKDYTGPDKEVYAQALTQFISLKNAWRNPTMHVGRSYDDSQILAIYISVRLFIDTLRPLLETQPAIEAKNIEEP